MIYLKEMNLEDGEKEYEFFRQMPSEHGFVNDYLEVSKEVFLGVEIPARLRASKGIDLLEGYVPDTYYFLWKDDIIIGLYRIRHDLNAFLKNGPGHIGYGILPAYRGKGYGSKGLSLAIERCKSIIKDDEIYMSCWISNPASLAIMLKNGAYIHHQDEKEYYTRIPIKK